MTAREQQASSLSRMPEQSTQSITIAAPASQVAEVITDFTAYPEWVQAVKSVGIVEAAEGGGDALPRQVQFSLDAGVVRDEYTLRYEYQLGKAGVLQRVEWDLVASNTQKSQQGSYELRDNGDSTTEVTYSLAVELAIPMLGMFRRKAERIIMDTALRELKKRVEQA